MKQIKKAGLTAIISALLATAALADSQYNPQPVPEPHSVVMARQHHFDDMDSAQPNHDFCVSVNRGEEPVSFADYSKCNPELFQSGGSDGGSGGSGGSAE